MSKITISFDCSQNQMMHGKRWVCKLGDQTLVGTTKADLKVKVEAAIRSHMKEPEVGVATYKGRIRMIVGHGGNTTAYRCETEKGGVANLSANYFSDEDVTLATERAVRHLCESAWSPGATTFRFEVPSEMPLSQVEAYKSWLKFQARYHNFALPEEF